MFLNQFEQTKNGNLDGVVTREEFDKAFQDLAVCVPSEEYCIKKICETWGVSEDDFIYVSKERIEEIMKIFRQKLMNKSNYNMDEFTLRNMFRNFDIDNNGTLSEVELAGLASKLGIDLKGPEI